MILTPLEVILILSYIGLANSWAIFAIVMNNFFHKDTPSVITVIACYLYNVIGFPFALWMAIIKTSLGDFDHHLKRPGTNEHINNLAHKLNKANEEIAADQITLKEANDEINRLDELIALSKNNHYHPLEG